VFRLIKIFYFLYLMLIGSLTQAFSQQGYLHIDCQHPGLNVKLNESTIGFTPIATLPLIAGTYRLSVTHPDKVDWKNEDWTEQILIVAEDTTIVRPQFQQQIILRSTPFDATVFLNNDFLGYTPLYFNFPLTDDKMIFITKEGYESISISASEIKSSTVDVSLKQINPLKKALQSSNKQQEKRLSKNAKISYGLMALSIGAGITSVYFKDQANKHYDRYLTAQNINDMNRYYNTCKKNDRYSSISLGLFEVTFVLSFYTLFKTIGD